MTKIASITVKKPSVTQSYLLAFQLFMLMLSICRVYTLHLLIKSRDCMNNGNPQTISKSDFKYCFQHTLSWDLQRLSPPSHLISFTPNEILAEVIWLKPGLICLLCSFSAHPVTVGWAQAGKSSGQEVKAQAHGLQALFGAGIWSQLWPEPPGDSCELPPLKSLTSVKKNGKFRRQLPVRWLLLPSSGGQTSQGSSHFCC